MARTWVLDTETKGTGAEMVPLEKVLERSRTAPKRERISILRRRAERETASDQPDPAPAPSRPREFKVVHGLSRQVLGEGLAAREALALLEGFRSVVDVEVYLWEPGAADWRPLTLAEKRVLWERRPQTQRR